MVLERHAVDHVWDGKTSVRAQRIAPRTIPLRSQFDTVDGHAIVGRDLHCAILHRILSDLWSLQVAPCVKLNVVVTVGRVGTPPAVGKREKRCLPRRAQACAPLLVLCDVVEADPRAFFRSALAYCCLQQVELGGVCGRAEVAALFFAEVSCVFPRLRAIVWVARQLALGGGVAVRVAFLARDAAEHDGVAHGRAGGRRRRRGNWRRR